MDCPSHGDRAELPHRIGNRKGEPNMPELWSPEVQSKARESAIQAFGRIRSVLHPMDPLLLLSRICIQCDFHEASPAGIVESYSSRWGSWAQMIARLVCLGDCTIAGSSPTAEDIDQLSVDLTEYSDGITIVGLSNNHPQPGDEIKMLAAESSMHATTVKHDAQPYQFYTAASRLYLPENKWLSDNLGFTVDEALATMHGIVEEVQLRLRQAMVATALEVSPDSPTDIKFQDLLLLALDKRPDLAVLTEKEIIDASTVSTAACTAVLKRFSQPVQGARDGSSVEAPDPLRFPSEFNPINKCPLIETDGRYVCVQLALLYESVFLSLHFDLSGDPAVLGNYGRERGAWLEQTAADYLVNVFGKGNVYTNPYRDDRNELCDVLVYFDNILLVVSCKAKMLTADAEYRNEAPKLKEDLQKGIGNSYNQLEGTLAYLKRSSAVDIFHADGTPWTTVRSSELDAIVPVYVLPSTYQNLIIDTQDMLSTLGLRIGADNVPWIVSVFDLQHVSEILDSPIPFLHYVSRRRELVMGITRVGGTEMDLLGCYLGEGLYFGPGSLFYGKGAVYLDNFSANVDFYLRALHEPEKNANKPVSRSPILRSGLAAEIVRGGVAHGTMSLMALLDLCEDSQNTFLDLIRTYRERSISRQITQFALMEQDHVRLVITYCIGTKRIAAVTAQANNWIQEHLKAGQYRGWEWICLVGQTTGRSRVQSIIHIPPQ